MAAEQKKHVIPFFLEEADLKGSGMQLTIGGFHMIKDKSIVSLIESIPDAVKKTAAYKEAAAEKPQPVETQIGADNGHGNIGPKEQSDMADRYYKEADYIKAVEWYRKAAEQGYAHAQYRLGYCYGKGMGVPKDLVKAVELIRKAADQEFDEAQYMLSHIYYHGIGVPRDLSITSENFTPKTPKFTREYFTPL
jgi:TPR repeat protein